MDRAHLESSRANELVSVKECSCTRKVSTYH